MKELLEWLEEYRVNILSLMGIGDYEQGQIDVLTDVINRVDPNKCSYCGQKDGDHKLSCPTTKVTVYLENDLHTPSNLKVHNSRLTERCKHVWRKDRLNGGWKCQVCTKTKEDENN